eukprot:1423698-Pyramimonas_sp.AAC.1
MRLTGASRDAAVGRGPSNEVQKRGRRRSHHRVARYGKANQVYEGFLKLRSDVRREMQGRAASL